MREIEDDCWHALSMADRMAIMADLREAHPLLKGRRYETSPLFRQSCIRAMRRRFPDIDADLQQAARRRQAKFNGEGGFSPVHETLPLEDLGDLDAALQRLNQGGVS